MFLLPDYSCEKIQGGARLGFGEGGAVGVMAHDLLNQLNLLFAVDFSVFLVKELVEFKVVGFQSRILVSKFVQRLFDIFDARR